VLQYLFYYYPSTAFLSVIAAALVLSAAYDLRKRYRGGVVILVAFAFELVYAGYATYQWHGIFDATVRHGNTVYPPLSALLVPSLLVIVAVLALVVTIVRHHTLCIAPAVIVVLAAIGVTTDTLVLYALSVEQLYDHQEWFAITTAACYYGAAVASFPAAVVAVGQMVLKRRVRQYAQTVLEEIPGNVH
jgi:hypothetical protein